MPPERDILLYQVETYMDAENFQEFLNETHIT